MIGRNYFWIAPDGLAVLYAINKHVVKQARPPGPSALSCPSPSEVRRARRGAASAPRPPGCAPSARRRCAERCRGGAPSAPQEHAGQSAGAGVGADEARMCRWSCGRGHVHMRPVQRPIRATCAGRRRCQRSSPGTGRLGCCWQREPGDLHGRHRRQPGPGATRPAGCGSFARGAGLSRLPAAGGSCCKGPRALRSCRR